MAWSMEEEENVDTKHVVWYILYHRFEEHRTSLCIQVEIYIQTSFEVNVNVHKNKQNIISQPSYNDNILFS